MPSTHYITHDVYEFMYAAKQISTNPSVTLIPKLPKLTERVARNLFLQEEVKEYLEAEENHDIVAIADSLIDMVYIIIGTCLKYGIPFYAVWDEVHNSNMQKLIPAPVLSEIGKVMKPAGWIPPDIHKVLVQHGYDPATTQQ